MNILIYNWTPLTETKCGGGVAIYVNNIINYPPHFKCINIKFLSSGFYYDKKKEVYIKDEGCNNNIPSFSIINSPVPAPLGILSAKDLSKGINDERSVRIFDEFLQREGPFDVIHFQTLEGISPYVLTLKKKYPNTKFVHSLHDYGCFCSNVKLWRSPDDVNCFLNRRSENCSVCRNGNTISCDLNTWLLNRSGQINSLQLFIYRVKRKVNNICSTNRSFDSHTYQTYRNLCVNLINEYVDIELAVSKRVKEIAESYGIESSKVVVSYIGTKVAENQIKHSSNLFDGKTLTILYMGYATKPKGFFDLCDVLLSLDSSIAKNIVLKFATSQTRESEKLICALKQKYKDVITFNGYSHSDFPAIFKDVNLGVVPPLWEDNLPQVTIEMIANGIPVITSMNGGAKELNSHEKFCYDTKSDFISKLEDIYKDKNLLTDYWSYSSELITMSKHMDQLLNLYDS